MYTKSQIEDFTKRIFVDEDSFDDPEQYNLIMAEMPEMDIYNKRKETVVENRNNKAKMIWKESSYEEPILTPNQEFHLFRKYNFLKFLAKDSLEYEKEIFRANNLIKKAQDIRNTIVLSNTRLIVKIIVKLPASESEYSEVFSETCEEVFRVVDRFNWRKGLKFSTYLYHAVLRFSYHSLRKTRGNRRGSKIRTFNTGGNNMVDEAIQGRSESECCNWYDQVKEATKIMLSSLEDKRHVEIIERRYGLNGYQYPFTLLEVGKVLGITKERVRQVELQAMRAIRKKLFDPDDFYSCWKEKIEELIEQE